eukprot:scaffold1936_cov201-Alexandrium_tamarense.AAC.13
MTGYNADLGHDVLERERWHYLSCDYHTEDTISADEASTKAETLTRVFDMLRGWDVFQMLQFVAPNERGGENKQIKEGESSPSSHNILTPTSHNSINLPTNITSCHVASNLITPPPRSIQPFINDNIAGVTSVIATTTPTSDSAMAPTSLSTVW